MLTEDDIIFNGEGSVSRTNAGTFNMGLDANQFTTNNPNLSVNFVIESDGKLVINKRNITLTSSDATKQYDGGDGQTRR